MKRSEMLNKIRSTLLNHSIDHDNFEKQILDTVEKLGMIPPYSGKIKQVNIIDRWGTDTGNIELARVMVNEWEPEDVE